jgi:hypothetical protein
MPGWIGILDTRQGIWEVKDCGTFSGFSSFETRQHVQVWVQGSFFIEPSTKISPAAFLADHFANGSLDVILPDLNGSFSAIIYSARTDEIILLTDRLGMQPIFIWEGFHFFGFSTQLQSFLDLKEFRVEIDTNALRCFLDQGQLLGEMTWFRHVHLLPAATIAVYAASEKRITSRKRYWTWGAIQPSKLKFEEAAEELGRLLKAAVNKRENPEGIEGLLLSGGLDSRAVLAAFSENARVVAITGGQAGTPDVRIAEKVSSLKGVPHQWLPLTQKNWFEGRLDAVWTTAGQISFLHHHFTPHKDLFASLCSAAWVGFLGDLAIGDRWMLKPDKRISTHTAERRFGKWAAIANPSDSFFDIEKEAPFWIDTRGRRFTNIGTAWLENEVPVQKPFLDNDLISFVFGVPDEYRQYNRLYSAALLHAFPDFFQHIPWQRTRFPIGYNTLTSLSLALKIPSVMARAGFVKPFVQYDKWLREDSHAIAALSDLLNPTRSVYPDYFRENWLERWLLPHLSGKKNYTEEICRAATLEYWLRCIFRKEYLLNQDP